MTDRKQAKAGADRELRASAEMRDRIADLLGREAARREAQGTGNGSTKAGLLRGMERAVRKLEPMWASADVGRWSRDGREL